MSFLNLVKAFFLELLNGTLLHFHFSTFQKKVFFTIYLTNQFLDFKVKSGLCFRIENYFIKMDFAIYSNSIHPVFSAIPI
jgi:hypothetical protein